MMKRLATLFVFLSGLAFAQPEYVALKESSLNAAASVVTVQAPATSAARLVRFTAAYIYCSVACDVTLERNGTAATATPLTPTPLVRAASVAMSKAFYASDVGVGTVVGKYTIAAGGTQVLDLSGVFLNRAGTTENLTLRTSAITGVARIAIQFKEEN